MYFSIFNRRNIKKNLTDPIFLNSSVYVYANDTNLQYLNIISSQFEDLMYYFSKMFLQLVPFSFTSV